VGHRVTRVNRGRVKGLFDVKFVDLCSQQLQLGKPQINCSDCFRSIGIRLKCQTEFFFLRNVSGGSVIRAFAP